MTTTIDRTWTFPNATELEPEGWLSPSQITEYINCGQCYYLRRVAKLATPLNIALPVGVAIHRAIETMRHQRLRPQGTEADPIEAAAAAFDELTTLPVDAETGVELILELGKSESIGAAKDDALRLARLALPWIAHLDAERGLIGAEYGLEEFANPYPFRMKGRIDALYGDAAGYITAISDTKSSSKSQAPDANAAIQLQIYRRFAGTGVKAAIDQIPKTKSPDLRSYWLSEGEDEAANVDALVLQVADDICAGRFPPRPGFLCKWDHGFGSFSVAVSGFGESQ